MSVKYARPAAAHVEPATPSWPNNATFWRNQRVTVTGGAGFLGSFVVEKLRAHGAAPLPPNSGGDLVQREAALALLHDARPDLITGLAILSLMRSRQTARERLSCLPL